jgi:hypothetical protein
MAAIIESSSTPDIPSSLGCKISPDLEDLAILSRGFTWIPNENGIRPTPENIQRKRDKLAWIESNWHSFSDYILNVVFEKPFVKRMTPDGAVKNKVCDHNVAGMIKFLPNEFPYQLRSGQHWVLWYGSPIQPVSDDRITETIREAILEICGPSIAFDFAW